MFSFKDNLDEDAVSCFSRLLELAPKSGLGRLGVGTKALLEGRYKEAVENLKEGWFSHQQFTQRARLQRLELFLTKSFLFY